MNCTLPTSYNLTSQRQTDDTFVTWYRAGSQAKIAFYTKPTSGEVGDIALLDVTIPTSGGTPSVGTVTVPTWNSTQYDDTDPDW